MIESFALLKGIVIGLLVALPSGPVGFICLRRIFAYGKNVGFVSGVGSSLVDAIYAFAAALGLASLAQSVPAAEFWMKIIGATFLVFFGLKICFAKPVNFEVIDQGRHNLWASFASAFVLTLANPSIIFSYAALFAGLNIITTEANGYLLAFALAGGIFLGAAATWFLLSRLETRMRQHLTAGGMRWVDIAVGFAVIGFGLSTLFTAF
jgi:threonine/homoserine/homoserine lactone efflux protein